MVLILHYNESKSFLFVKATKLNQIKTKNSEVKDYALCLGNISKDFTINNLKKKNTIKRNCKVFRCWRILDIHKYLMKGTWFTAMFELIKKIFIGLLTGISSTSIHTKCISLSNQKCMIPPTLLIYILMNTVKKFTAIHLLLN